MTLTTPETARVADQGGAAMFTVMDHWFQMENLGGPAEPMLEGYTTLGYLAAVTERVRLSLLVSGTTYRHPGLLAKTVTTLDVLSGGRAMFGIGAAWYEREHVGLGVPFPAMTERFERLEETVQICRQMWSTEDGAFDGAHYQLAETVCVPPPLHKLEVLKRHCDDAERDYADIEKTMIYSGGPLEDVEASCSGWRSTPPSASSWSRWCRPVTTRSRGRRGCVRTCSRASRGSDSGPGRSGHLADPPTCLTRDTFVP